MDEPPITWRVIAVVCWASAMLGWATAGLTLNAYERLKARRPQEATTTTPFPRS